MDVDQVGARMAEHRACLERSDHGGLDDLHVELDKSAVHEAAREHDLATLSRIYADQGVESIRALDKYGLTPLHWAADRGHAEIAQFLLESGVDATAIETRLFHRTALHFAALCPSLSVVQLLLAHGAEVSATEYRGWTPLHCAAYAGATEVVRELLTARADARAQTHTGDTALHLAASNNHSETVAVLLALSCRGELLGIPNAKGDVAYRVAETKGHMQLMTLLRPT